MKQSNKKTPVVFYLSFVLLCAVLITTHMMSGLYARYSTTVAGSATTRVAQISYKFEPSLTNGELVVSSHPLDTNEIPPTCSVVAFEETFILINDGEVAYDYVLSLTLTHNNHDLSDYSLTSISNSAWVASTKTTTVFESGKFYYYTDDDSVLKSASSPTLTGTLGIGEKVTYKILYFINADTAEFNQKNVLGYNITCTQID